MTPILQFGTSRFLQAHVDLFVSEALDRGEALGRITIVQTTASAESASRVAAFGTADGFAVKIRGLADGAPIDRQLQVCSVAAALQAAGDWPEVRRIATEEARVILSNTGESGYRLDPADDATCVRDEDRVPRSFPAKLLVLLFARWENRPDAPLSLFPCELVARNGDTLRDLLCDLAREWALPNAFLGYLRTHCVWANSLVDRIVSEPLHPVGAVAEPYALWAIERTDGLVLPCRHEAIVLTDDLARFERLKLNLLNLGHSVLAETWFARGRPDDATVRALMDDAAARQVLETVWRDEVVPVFVADGLGPEAESYLKQVRDRFLNPYLVHRLADIAQHHAEKKRRRMQPVILRAEALRLAIPQPWMRAALQSPHGAA